MRGTGPDGKEMDSCGIATYEQIKAPEKIVYMDSFSDKEGKILENMPSMQITVSFEALGDQTKVTSETIFANKEALDEVVNMGMEAGVKETWDRLDQYLLSAA